MREWPLKSEREQENEEEKRQWFLERERMGKNDFWREWESKEENDIEERTRKILKGAWETMILKSKWVSERWVWKSWKFCLYGEQREEHVNLALL